MHYPKDIPHILLLLSLFRKESNFLMEHFSNTNFVTFFQDMDEKKSIITVDSWMRMGWNDSALVWDPDKFDGVLTMHFESDELWKPDILLYNK